MVCCLRDVHPTGGFSSGAQLQFCHNSNDSLCSEELSLAGK